MSRIEWTERTWNPSVGCTKVSTGCKNCYAEVMAYRLRAMGNKDYADGFKFKMLSDRLDLPKLRKKRTIFFVNSMSDLFHEEMSFDFLDRVFEVMEQTPWHTYQILTKRPQVMYDYCKNKTVADNIFLGVSVENKMAKKRIDILRKIRCRKFLSIEPLLEDLGELAFDGICLVIVGGESGLNARRMNKQWVLNIRKQCQEQATPFLFKQWGAYGEDGIKRSKKENGRWLDGFLYGQKENFLNYPIFIEKG